MQTLGRYNKNKTYLKALPNIKTWKTPGTCHLNFGSFLLNKSASRGSLNHVVL